MNKQNKKIAQEKRRIEREKAEKKAKVVNLLKFWVPVVAVVVVVIVLIWAVATSGGSSSNSTDGTANCITDYRISGIRDTKQ